MTSHPVVRASRVALNVAVLVALASPVAAQRGARRPGRGRAVCPAPDTTAEWYRSQRLTLVDSVGSWSDDTLRNALLQAAGLTEAQALKPQEGWQLTDRAAAPNPLADAMVAQLKTAVGRGSATPWPTREIVGLAGVRAIAFLVQRDSTLERSAMHRLMEAGPGTSLPADVAVLEDRVRLEAGRKQIYGTQMLSNPLGLPKLLPIEDSAHVDLRRDAAGLPPLRNALCAAAAVL